MQLVEKSTEAPSKFDTNQETLPKGILARVTYPIMRFNQVNANSRKYSRAVGEAVLNDPDVKDKLAKRTLFGDQEHPPTETQIRLDADKTSHVISNLYIDESDNTLKMEMDLLPTKAGRFLYTLLECGCQIGVSTRATGDLEEAVDETTGEKYSTVKPSTFKLSTVDATGDASTPDAIPEKIIKGVQKGYESHFIDRAIAISLLEKVNTKEAKQLRESIEKAEDKKILTEVKEKVNTIPKSNKIIAESIVKYNDKLAIVNQVFESTKKALIQVGVERKVVALSECTLVEEKLNEAECTYCGYDASDPEIKKEWKGSHLCNDCGAKLTASQCQSNDGFCATCKAKRPEYKKNMKEAKKPKKGFYRSKAGEEMYVNSDDLGTGKVAIVTEKGDDYMDIDVFMTLVDKGEFVLDEKRIGESFVGFDKKSDGFVQPVKESDPGYVQPAPAEGAVMEEPEPRFEEETPEAPAEETPEEAKKISDFETMEEMYDYVVQEVPALKDFDEAEVIKGLIHEQNHNEGEYDILFDDVHKLANIVCVELTEMPDYYTKIEELIDEEKESNPAEEGEEDAESTPVNGAEESSGENTHPVDPQLFTPGMEETIKQINHSKVNEAILKAEKETILEMAEAAVRELQEKYITDVVGLTERIQGSTELTEDINSLKVRITEAEATQKTLAETLTVKESDLVVLNKKLVELQETAQMRAEEIAGLNARIDESKKLYEKNLAESRIKTMAAVTGLKLDERTTTLLMECKNETELVTKLEECRDKLARATLHSNIVESVTIKAPQGKTDVLLDSIGPIMDQMAGR